MRRFRRLFALLFILSLFIGALHQASHDHHSGELCEVCVLSHGPALLNDTPALVLIEPCNTPFIVTDITLPTPHTLSARSRSPPIA